MIRRPFRRWAYKREDFDNFQLVPITEIDSKIILLTVNNKKYLCKLPNNVESQ